MFLICLFKSLWNLIIYFDFISGHDYILDYEDGEIQTLKCTKCGHKSIGYKIPIELV